MHETAMFLSPANLRLLLNFPTTLSMVDLAFNKDNGTLTSSLASLLALSVCKSFSHPDL